MKSENTRSNVILENKIESFKLKERITQRSKDKNDPRGMYFRDATAIIHSTPFRRLKHKTQVFFAPKNDHICTRLEHVLHVATIAVSICKGLGLNEDMAFAIGLGHDLGHTPFGHFGEQMINKCFDDGFHHELHSLRVVDLLYDLNLCFAVRDGIVSHCGEKFEQKITPSHRVDDIESYTDLSHDPASYEGAVVRMADKIAYLGRDYEDAEKLGVIPPDDLPVHIRQVFGHDDNSSIIDLFARDVIHNAEKQGYIGFSEDVYDALCSFKDYNYKYIYLSESVMKQKKKLEELLGTLFRYLEETVKNYGLDVEAYKRHDLKIIRGLGNHMEQHWKLYEELQTQDHKKILIDFFAGMTDNYLIEVSKELFYPET